MARTPSVARKSRKEPLPPPPRKKKLPKEEEEQLKHVVEVYLKNVTDFMKQQQKEPSDFAPPSEDEGDERPKKNSKI